MMLAAPLSGSAMRRTLKLRTKLGKESEAFCAYQRIGVRTRNTSWSCIVGTVLCSHS